MPKNPVKNSQRDIERAAKLLAYIYEANFIGKRRMLWLNFVRGFMHGVGGFLGATLGVGLLLWIASFLFDVPLLGSLIEALRDIAR